MTDQQFIISLVIAIASPFFLFVSGALALLFQWVSSQEQRRRDLEDRKELAAGVKQAAELAHLVAQHAQEDRAVIHAALTDVGNKATAAYGEANQSNLKIQAVQDVLGQIVGLPQKDITALTDTGRLRLDQSKTIPRPNNQEK